MYTYIYNNSDSNNNNNDYHLRLKIGMEYFFKIALANVVFPQPDGPIKRSPKDGLMPYKIRFSEGKQQSINKIINQNTIYI
jgi:hypothetical protein